MSIILLRRAAWLLLCATTPTWGTVTPTATSSPTLTITGSPTPTSTPSRTNTDTSTLSPTLTQTSTSTPTSSLSPTPTLTASLTQTSSLTQTFSPTPTTSTTMSETPTGSVTPTPTGSVTITPTLTVTGSATPTTTVTFSPTPTVTATKTETNTLTLTNTPTPTISSTLTETMTSTSTPTPTITSTLTPTVTLSSTVTVTPTATMTVTPSVTPTVTTSMTPTMTASPTGTVSPTPTHTATRSTTVTFTPTPTLTRTVTTSPTQTVTATRSVTPTPTITLTRTVTASPTATDTRTESETLSTTQTPTYTQTYTTSRTHTINQVTGLLGCIGGPPVRCFGRSIVTITGVGFSTVPAENSVNFVGTMVPRPVCVPTTSTATTITCTLVYEDVPAGAQYLVAVQSRGTNIPSNVQFQVAGAQPGAFSGCAVPATAPPGCRPADVIALSGGPAEFKSDSYVSFLRNGAATGNNTPTCVTMGVPTTTQLMCTFGAEGLAVGTQWQILTRTRGALHVGTLPPLGLSLLAAALDAEAAILHSATVGRAIDVTIVSSTSRLSVSGDAAKVVVGTNCLSGPALQSAVDTVLRGGASARVATFTFTQPTMQPLTVCYAATGGNFVAIPPALLQLTVTGVPAAAQSTVMCQPTTIRAGGASQCTITARDAAGNVVPALSTDFQPTVTPASILRVTTVDPPAPEKPPAGGFLSFQVQAPATLTTTQQYSVQAVLINTTNTPTASTTVTAIAPTACAATAPTAPGRCAAGSAVSGTTCVCSTGFTCTTGRCVVTQPTTVAVTTFEPLEGVTLFPTAGLGGSPTLTVTNAVRPRRSTSLASGPEAGEVLLDTTGTVPAFITPMIFALDEDGPVLTRLNRVQVNLNTGSTFVTTGPPGTSNPERSPTCSKTLGMGVNARVSLNGGSNATFLCHTTVTAESGTASFLMGGNALVFNWVVLRMQVLYQQAGLLEVLEDATAVFEAGASINGTTTLAPRSTLEVSMVPLVLGSSVIGDGKLLVMGTTLTVAGYPVRTSRFFIGLPVTATARLVSRLSTHHGRSAMILQTTTVINGCGTTGPLTVTNSILEVNLLCNPPIQSSGDVRLTSNSILRGVNIFSNTATAVPQPLIAANSFIVDDGTTIQYTLAPGYVPTAGQVVPLARFVSGSLGTHTLVNPTLPAGITAAASIVGNQLVLTFSSTFSPVPVAFTPVFIPGPPTNSPLSTLIPPTTPPAADDDGSTAATIAAIAAASLLGLLMLLGFMWYAFQGDEDSHERLPAGIQMEIHPDRPYAASPSDIRLDMMKPPMGPAEFDHVLSTIRPMSPTHPGGPFGPMPGFSPTQIMGPPGLPQPGMMSGPFTPPQGFGGLMSPFGPASNPLTAALGQPGMGYAYVPSPMGSPMGAMSASPPMSPRGPF